MMTDKVKTYISSKGPCFRARLFRLLKIIGITALAGIGLVIFYRVFGFGIPCLIHQSTGLYCPGCGMMRAIDAMLRLDFYAAVRYNLLSVILLPVIAVLLAFEARRYLYGKEKRRGKWELILSVALIAIALAYCILRNVPQFAFLQPMELCLPNFI